MPSPSRRPVASAVPVLVVGALLALALGACDVVREVGSRSWSQAVSNQAGTEHVTTVTDRSGRVVDVEFDPADANLFEPVTAAPGRPNALDVAWTAGACDATTVLDIAPSGPGLAVKVAIEGNGQACDAFGIPGVVRLVFAEPVPAGAVTVTQ